MEQNGKFGKRIVFERCAIDTYMTACAPSGADKQMTHINFEPAQPVSNLEQVIAKVRYYLENERHNDRDTIDMYVGYIRTMWRMGFHDPTLEKTMELLDVLRTKERPNGKVGLAPSTINHYVEAITHWSNAIKKPLVDDEGKVVKLKKIRVRGRRRVDALNPEEFVILINACNTNKKRYIVAGLGYLGLRPTELAELRVGDLNLKDGYVSIIDHGKGLKTGEREVSIVDEFLQFFHPWYEERHRISIANDHRPLEPNDYLLVNQWYKPYDYHDIYQEVRRIAAKTSLKGKVYPYKLRKTYGTNAANTGVPVNILANEMGHSDERTTLRYYVGAFKDINRRVMNQKFTYFK